MYLKAMVVASKMKTKNNNLVRKEEEEMKNRHKVTLSKNKKNVTESIISSSSFV